MDTSRLTPEQAAALAAKLAPMLGYLVRLTDRMQKRGWRSDDEAYRPAWRARNEMHELCVRLRYQACGNPGNRGGARGAGRRYNGAPLSSPCESWRNAA